MSVASGKESLCMWIVKRRADASALWKCELVPVYCEKES